MRGGWNGYVSGVFLEDESGRQWGTGVGSSGNL